MKKTAISVIGIALLLAVLPMATVASSPYNAEIVWGNNVEWQMLAPPGPGTSNSWAIEPLYIVAPQTANPQSTADNNHIPGVAHDHVLAPPPGNGGTYNPNWEVYLVLCTPPAIVAGTCNPVFSTFPGPGGPGTGPTLPLAYHVNGQPLTSDAAIDSALASGLVVLHDTGIHFICIVQALK
jgi:hypothetical protein